jgi:hypothetical protein
MEVTGPQMVLTMKLTTFAWNVYDGRRKVEVCLTTFVFYEKKSGLKYHSGIGQMASRKKDYKIPILT